ncbi:elongation factor P maturation arginine rhamnosyltransferase EarP [Paludibacterium denitrificans]|uniref:elongation factor P maturation arginine rhamnosyltransferase EarP n=1 Tax=Paludibacterium denitrificans TaxID=2675226 RepID=UPI0028AB448D|nr:elongation factor P maturation arginine rhamnosyltransferase EarP [Paludibacterium denitrificans]
MRLWVDDLASFGQLLPQLDPAAEQQQQDDITICHWRRDAFPADVVPGDVVIEAFGCELPDSFQEAMATQPRPPVWINLEYLSAEEWVEGCHGLPSPHPRLPLTKYFFFPGLGAQTGGLLCEAGLPAQRQQWQRDALAQRAYWQTFNLPPAQPGEWRVSLFAYENPAATELLALWALGDRPITCLVPVGKVLPDVAKVFGQPLQVGQRLTQGNLTVQVLPMTDQASYDLLLWSCDINFVRGEDSFVRAQWAARPFVWHIYPQQEDAHLLKLDAFLSHYTAPLSPDASRGHPRTEPCPEPRTGHGRRPASRAATFAGMADTQPTLDG